MKYKKVGVLPIWIVKSNGSDSKDILELRPSVYIHNRLIVVNNQLIILNKSRHVHGGGLSLRRKRCFLKVFTKVASSKMFLKICIVMSDYCVADHAFRCCLILDNEMFSDITSTSRHEGQTTEAKSKKLCDKSQVECLSKLLNFEKKKVFKRRKGDSAEIVYIFTYLSMRDGCPDTI